MIKTIVSKLITLAIIYLIFAFVSEDYNFINWNETMIAACAVVVVFAVFKNR
jgi:hypothetical protein